MSGLFLTFEGGEGSGKSTQLELLAQWLEGRGRRVFCTREPGGTPLGERIRDGLLGPWAGGMDPLAELLLFEADRAQHVAEVIHPRLEAGEVVLCDRFTHSTLAYQAFGRGLPEEMVARLNAWAAGGLEPDLTLVLDVDAEEGLRRLAEVGRLDRLEAEALDFHRRVCEGFRKLARRDAQRVRLIPPSSVTETHRAIVKAVKEVLEWAGRPSAGSERPSLP
ncbi:MAG: dTMP kinase [Nitrospinota bacterium]